jgi:hypothetical protein
MAKKVFCESCRHYGDNGLGGYCRSVENIEGYVLEMDSNYYTKNYSYGTPAIINEHNNCPNWTAHIS